MLYDWIGSLLNAKGPFAADWFWRFAIFGGSYSASDLLEYGPCSVEVLLLFLWTLLITSVHAQITTKYRPTFLETTTSGTLV